MDANTHTNKGALILSFFLIVISSCKNSDPEPISITSFSPDQGIVGTSVTINGDGFSTELTKNIIKFNGTAATILTATATQLTTTVPQGASTGKLSVELEGR